MTYACRVWLSTFVNYKRAPVTEIGCGLLLPRPVAFGARHAGMLWERFGVDRLPEVQDITLEAHPHRDGNVHEVHGPATLTWFGLAHEWIVRASIDITTPEMHSAWGRTK